MIVIRYLILIFHLILILNSISAQIPLNAADSNSGCGTKMSIEQVEYMNSTREIRAAVDVSVMRNQVINIPVAIHVVVQDDGPLGPEDLTSTQVDDAIENLNSAFEDIGFNFVMCPNVNYIAEDSYPWPDTDRDIYPSFPQGSFTTPNPDNESEWIVAKDNRVKGMLNIFFAPVLDNNPDLFGWAGFAGFKGILDYDWVVVKNDVANTNVLAHEIGHYFNLYHTTQGESDITGNVIANEVVARPPDGSNTCPNNDPNNPGFMDTDIKCNCGPNVGDELCDTPAAGQHHQFLECVIDCEYVLGDDLASEPCTTYGVSNPITNDSNGDHYEPDVGNIMAYTYYECLSHFSPQQIDRMLVSLVVDRPELLSKNDCLYCPQFVSFQNFNVHDVNTFEVYSVEQDIISRADVKTGNIYTTYNAGESICLNPDFEAEYGSTFIAYIDGCENPSRIGISIKGEFTNNVSIQPNPFSNQTTIVYQVFNEDAVTLSVSDIMGTKIATLTKNEQKQAGKHQATFDGSNLPAGIYYCTIQTGNQIETQKMVLTK